MVKDIVGFAARVGRSISKPTLAENRDKSNIIPNIVILGPCFFLIHKRIFFHGFPF